MYGSTKIGRYEIKAEIGQGMATVYRAYDPPSSVK
jgi:hypothetical protein